MPLGSGNIHRLTMQAVIDFPGEPDRCRHKFANPCDIFVAWKTTDVPGVITRAAAAARRGAWAIGHVAYEAAPAFDSSMRVHAARAGLPLACFAVYAQPAEEVDGDKSSEWRPSGYEIGSAWVPLLDRAPAMARVEEIRQAIGRGDVYQVNLTTCLRTPFAGSGLAYFHALRRAQPAGYGLYLDGGTWQVLSVSPELFFDWTAAGELTAQPMKGTAPRHADPQRDAAAMRVMQESAKERAENLMIVDLLRNDLSRVAEVGSVHVPVLFEAQALPTAWQMTSTVRCRTRGDVDLHDIFAALFPCGSVTGAPKLAAMQAIRALEPEARGVYCGALGVIRPGGHATFSVAIRTVMVDAVAGSAECGIGSGITWDSNAGSEWEEWQIKRRFLERAAALAAGG